MGQWIAINRRDSDLIHLLLLHQFGIRTVIYNAGTKDRGSEGAVDFLGIGIFQLSVEDEFVALSAKKDGSLSTQKHECEDVAILGISLAILIHDAVVEKGNADLFAAFKEEFKRVDAVGDSTSNERNPMENNWRFFRISEQQLAQDIKHDQENKGGTEYGGKNNTSGPVRKLVAKWPGQTG